MLHWSWKMSCVRWRNLLVQLTIVLAVSSYEVNIQTSKPVNRVNARFIGITIDPDVFFNSTRTTKLLELARAMSPGYLRLSGHFNTHKYEGELRSRSSAEMKLKLLSRFCNSSGLQLIVTANPELRHMDGSWDETNTRDLLHMADMLNMNFALQMGYERPRTEPNVSGLVLGEDIAALASLTREFPRFRNTLIVGPDINTVSSARDAQRLKQLIFSSKNSLDVITWHPNLSTIKNYGDEEELLMKAAVAKDELTMQRREIFDILQSTPAAKKPMWLGSSSPLLNEGEGKGRFVDGLVWASRLGQAARLGIDAVMYSPSTDDMSYSSPEFWVSILHRQLVGRKVLNTQITDANARKLHVFAHCSKDGNGTGSVTVFAVNYALQAASVNIAAEWRAPSETGVKVFLLTPENGPLSRNTMLNGKRLKVPKKGEIPKLKPEILPYYGEAGINIFIPPISIIFLEIQDTYAEACRPKTIRNKHFKNTFSPYDTCNCNRVKREMHNNYENMMQSIRNINSPAPEDTGNWTSDDLYSHNIDEHAGGCVHSVNSKRNYFTETDDNNRNLPVANVRHRDPTTTKTSSLHWESTTDTAFLKPTTHHLENSVKQDINAAEYSVLTNQYENIIPQPPVAFRDQVDAVAIASENNFERPSINDEYAAVKRNEPHSNIMLASIAQQHPEMDHVQLPITNQYRNFNPYQGLFTMQHQIPNKFRQRRFLNTETVYENELSTISSRDIKDLPSNIANTLQSSNDNAPVDTQTERNSEGLLEQVKSENSANYENNVNASRIELSRTADTTNRQQQKTDTNKKMELSSAVKKNIALKSKLPAVSSQTKLIPQRLKMQHEERLKAIKEKIKMQEDKSSRLRRQIIDTSALGIFKSGASILPNLQLDSFTPKQLFTVNKVGSAPAKTSSLLGTLPKNPFLGDTVNFGAKSTATQDSVNKFSKDVSTTGTTANKDKIIGGLMNVGDKTTFAIPRAKSGGFGSSSFFGKSPISNLGGKASVGTNLGGKLSLGNIGGFPGALGLKSVTGGGSLGKSAVSNVGNLGIGTLGAGKSAAAAAAAGVATGLTAGKVIGAKKAITAGAIGKAGLTGKLAKAAVVGKAGLAGKNLLALGLGKKIAADKALAAGVGSALLGKSLLAGKAAAAGVGAKVATGKAIAATAAKGLGTKIALGKAFNLGGKGLAFGAIPPLGAKSALGAGALPSTPLFGKTKGFRSSALAAEQPDATKDTTTKANSDNGNGKLNFFSGGKLDAESLKSYISNLRSRRGNNAEQPKNSTKADLKARRRRALTEQSHQLRTDLGRLKHKSPDSDESVPHRVDSPSDAVLNIIDVIVSLQGHGKNLFDRLMIQKDKQDKLIDYINSFAPISVKSSTEKGSQSSISRKRTMDLWDENMATKSVSDTKDETQGTTSHPWSSSSHALNIFASDENGSWSSKNDANEFLKSSNDEAANKRTRFPRSTDDEQNGINSMAYIFHKWNTEKKDWSKKSHRISPIDEQPMEHHTPSSIVNVATEYPKISCADTDNPKSSPESFSVFMHKYFLHPILIGANHFASSLRQVVNQFM